MYCNDLLQERNVLPGDPDKANAFFQSSDESNELSSYDSKTFIWITSNQSSEVRSYSSSALSYHTSFGLLPWTCVSLPYP